MPQQTVVYSKLFNNVHCTTRRSIQQQFICISRVRSLVWIFIYLRERETKSGLINKESKRRSRIAEMGQPELQQVLAAIIFR